MHKYSAVVLSEPIATQIYSMLTPPLPNHTLNRRIKMHKIQTQSSTKNENTSIADVFVNRVLWDCL